MFHLTVFVPKMCFVEEVLSAFIQEVLGKKIMTRKKFDNISSQILLSFLHIITSFY